LPTWSVIAERATRTVKLGSSVVQLGVVCVALMGMVRYWNCFVLFDSNSTSLMSYCRKYKVKPMRELGRMAHVLVLIRRTRRLWGDLGCSALICMLVVSLESSTRRIGSLQSCSGSHAVEFVGVEGCMGSTRYLKLEPPWIDAPTKLSPSSLPQTSEETSKRANTKS